MKKKTIVLPHPKYEPTKKELNEPIKLDGLPDGSVMDRMNAIADALMQPVDVKYVEKK